MCSPRMLPFVLYGIILLSTITGSVFFIASGNRVNLFMLVFIFHLFSKLFISSISFLVLSAKNFLDLPGWVMICVMSSA